MSHHSITDFLLPISKDAISNDEGYKDTQLGKHILTYEEESVFPDFTAADFILVGCGEMRGVGLGTNNYQSANAIRSAYYGLFHWHKDVLVADAGNIKTGATLRDSYAAIRSVVGDLVGKGKKVVLIGGSHDITLAQYDVYAHTDTIVEATCIDAKIDLNMDSILPADHFLMEMLTNMPNYIKHYNHIGFQSYFVHPQMLETIDKLRFDCYRVGKVKEHLEEMEPAIRNSHLFSFDISAIQNAHAPANRCSPNGLTGEEACVLMQYAGMSNNTSTIGLYGYVAKYDVHDLTAKQISHMLWYIMDGIHKGKQEADIADRASFKEFNLAFAEVETTFLQSKKTGRWWMRMPDEHFVACSKFDYIIASNNEIPERWMRTIERN